MTNQWNDFMDNLEDIPIEDSRYIVSKLKSIDINLNENRKFTLLNNVSNCDLCDGKIIRYKNIYNCEDCGVEITNTANSTEESYSVSAATECNVSANGCMPFTFMGPKHERNKKSLYKTCASYTKFRKYNILREMKTLMLHSKDHSIPKHILKEANDLFAKVKDANVVLRANGHKGVISACIYYACYNNDISKTPTELSKLMGIEEKFHSKGIRVLQDLNENGLIELPRSVSTISDFVERNLEALYIPHEENGIRYRDFVMAIILKAERKKLHVINDCKNTTKAAGAIYLLTRRIPKYNSIAKETMDKEWKISKTTYIRYYKMIIRYYKFFKKIFKQYGIPMPIEWKSINR